MPSRRPRSGRKLAKYGDVVASVVNLQYRHGAIGNVESYAQAVYGYDVRTESRRIEGLDLCRQPAAAFRPCFLRRAAASRVLADHFLTRFADAYLAEVRDFVHNMLHGRAPRVTGEDGLKALAIAVAAEKSHLQAKPVDVSLADVRTRHRNLHARSSAH